MSGFGQRSRPWPATPAPPDPAEAADARGEASTLRDFGTSMDAISFGFAATAILVSMFLLMAIFEHLIKPHAFPPGDDFPSPAAPRRRSAAGKHRSQPVEAADLSVLMPGQRFPTYLAQPAPLPREGVHWPPHDDDDRRRRRRSYMPP